MKGFTIYEHGGHLGHVTRTILIHFHFHVPKAYIQNLVKMAQWFLRKASFNFQMQMALDQGHELTLTFNTHIPS